MGNDIRVLQRIVMGTPVVSGFSYAFLRLLFNRLEEMTRDGVEYLFVSYDEHRVEHQQEIYPEAIAILNHICDQMKIPAIVGGNGNGVRIREVGPVIAVAEDFLKIFEGEDPAEDFLKGTESPEDGDKATDL